MKDLNFTVGYSECLKKIFYKNDSLSIINDSSECWLCKQEAKKLVRKKIVGIWICDDCELEDSENNIVAIRSLI